MIIDKKCTCGSKSTGNTTIRCCNLCGLPLPNEPWHFNLDENIFSRVEKPVKPANGDIPERCTKEFINFLLVNALRNLTGEQREILTKALVERSEYYQKTFDNIIKEQEEAKQIIKEIKSRLSV